MYCLRIEETMRKMSEDRSGRGREKFGSKVRKRVRCAGGFCYVFHPVHNL